MEIIAKMEDISKKFANCQCLNGSWLKVIAMVSMLIDHTASHLLRHAEAFNEPLISLGHHHMTWYILMRCVGRLAFPLFAFLLVEGFMHTHSRKHYGRNLLMFALISEIPWNLTHGGHLYGLSQNVFFTLFLGYLGLCAIEHYREDRFRQACALLGLFVLSILLHCDYGCRGFSFIIMLYLLRHQPLFRAIVGAGLFGWIPGLAFIPISMYNGCRGFIQGPFAKYIFYAFYPAHLLVLYFIKMWFH